MARGAFSSGNYLTVSSAPVSGNPLSMGCWFRSDNITNFQCIAQIGTDGSLLNAYSLGVRGNTAGDPAFLGARSGGVTRTATTSTGYSADTWHHILGIVASGTDRTIYLDGGGAGTSTSAVNPGTLNQLELGQFLDDTSPLTGDIAEFAMWNVALTATEAAKLGAGISPLCIRPGNLVFYAPMIRGASGGDDFDIVGGNILTETGTVPVIEHPRIFMPSAPMIIGVPSAAGGTNIDAITDTLTITEQAADVSLDVDIAATTDALILTEQAATVALDVDIAATTPALVITEQTAAISHDIGIAANFDALILTEQAATVSLDVDIAATTPALVITEQTAIIVFDVNIDAGFDALTVTTNQATVELGAGINAGIASLTLTEQAATIVYDIDIAANLDTLTITGQAATVSFDIDIAANLDTLTITGQAATVSLESGIAANFDALILTEQAATISLDVNISAGFDALILSEQAATVAETAQNYETVEFSLMITREKVFNLGISRTWP